MKRVINKSKLWKLITIIALVVVMILLGTLIVTNMLKKNEGTKYVFVEEDDHDEEDHLHVADQELMKSSEDLYADNDFLIESFNEYEDGDRFYLAGTNLIDYDRMIVFYGELSREDIVEKLAWNYEEIKDKAEDDVLVVFMKGNVLYRLFNMKESECGFNFYPGDNEVYCSTQSANEDVYYKTRVENGVKKHILDYYGLNPELEEDINKQR